MAFFHGILSVLLLVCPLFSAADNAELKQIYDADQKDREGQSIDWSKVGPRDVAREMRVREMIDQALLVTGKDYERAAMVFQHGGSADDILLAHILAVTALGKGETGARWLAAASLDRFLQRVGQAQVFGTQYSFKKPGDPWTMEPYNRKLVSPLLRDANCVPGMEDQAGMLESIIQGAEPKPPKKKPCAEPAKP